VPSGSGALEPSCLPTVEKAQSCNSYTVHNDGIQYLYRVLVHLLRHYSFLLRCTITTSRLAGRRMVVDPGVSDRLFKPLKLSCGRSAIVER
jgi:hypothetical protein